ncbi:MAG: plastocyanin/azurin family copper-binding protein [Longimicrobiales bacterium]
MMRRRYLTGMSAGVVALALVYACGGGGDGGNGGMTGPTTGTVSGSVQDDANAAVPGATLTLSGSGITARNATSTATGGYSFTQVAPGSYTVTIAAPSGYSLGTNPASRNVSVTAGATATADFVLDKDEAPENVQIVNLTASFTFEPANVTITPGTTVRWVWQGGGAHTVTPAGHSEWQEASLSGAGQTFEHTFNNAGDFDYFCTPHQAQGMTGNVTVQ